MLSDETFHPTGNHPLRPPVHNLIKPSLSAWKFVTHLVVASVKLPPHSDSRIASLWADLKAISCPMVINPVFHIYDQLLIIDYRTGISVIPAWYNDAGRMRLPSMASALAIPITAIRAFCHARKLSKLAIHPLPSPPSLARLEVNNHRRTF